MAKIGPDWNILTYMLCRLNLQRPLVFTDKAPPKKTNNSCLHFNSGETEHFVSTNK